MILWFKKPKKYWSNIFTSPVYNLRQYTTECHEEVFPSVSFRNADNFTLQNETFLPKFVATNK